MDEQASKLEFLRAYLAERDVPCPLCGYSLRALRAGRCPECGSDVEITVGLTEPRMAAFIAGVVGLAIGLGFNGLLLGWIAVMMAGRMRGGPPMSMMAPLIVGFIATAAGTAVWLRSRRRIRRMKPGTRRVLVGACYALSIGMALWFFAGAR